MVSSSSFAATLDLAPRPSPRAHRYLFLLHAGLLVLLLIAIPAGGPLALLALGLGISWLWLRRHPVFGFGSRALTRLIWHAEGYWTVHEASGRRVEAELQADSLLHPRLLVLNFRGREDGRRRTRVLLGDELDPDVLRRLRARLALSPSPD
jgi:toxin CptA